MPAPLHVTSTAPLSLLDLILGWRGLGGSGFSPRLGSHPRVLLCSSGSGREPLQKQGASPCARASPGYLLWRGGILRISTICFFIIYFVFLQFSLKRKDENFRMDKRTQCQSSMSWEQLEQKIQGKEF